MINLLCPSVALMIFLCGTDDIPFAVLMESSAFVCYKKPPGRHLLTLMTGVPYGYLGLPVAECNLQDKYKCHLRVILLQPEYRI